MSKKQLAMVGSCIAGDPNNPSLDWGETAKLTTAPAKLPGQAPTQGYSPDPKELHPCTFKYPPSFSDHTGAGVGPTPVYLLFDNADAQTTFKQAYGGNAATPDALVNVIVYEYDQDPKTKDTVVSHVYALLGCRVTQAPTPYETGGLEMAAAMGNPLETKGFTVGLQPTRMSDFNVFTHKDSSYTTVQNKKGEDKIQNSLNETFPRAAFP